MAAKRQATKAKQVAKKAALAAKRQAKKEAKAKKAADKKTKMALKKKTDKKPKIAAKLEAWEAYPGCPVTHEASRSTTFVAMPRASNWPRKVVSQACQRRCPCRPLAAEGQPGC